MHTTCTKAKLYILEQSPDVDDALTVLRYVCLTQDFEFCNAL